MTSSFQFLEVPINAPWFPNVIVVIHIHLQIGPLTPHSKIHLEVGLKTKYCADHRSVSFLYEFQLTIVTFASYQQNTLEQRCENAGGALLLKKNHLDTHLIAYRLLNCIQGLGVRFRTYIRFIKIPQVKGSKSLRHLALSLTDNK